MTSWLHCSVFSCTSGELCRSWAGDDGIEPGSQQQPLKSHLVDALPPKGDGFVANAIDHSCKRGDTHGDAAAEHMTPSRSGTCLHWLLRCWGFSRRIRAWSMSLDLLIPVPLEGTFCWCCSGVQKDLWGVVIPAQWNSWMLENLWWTEIWVANHESYKAGS